MDSQEAVASGNGEGWLGFPVLTIAIFVFVVAYYAWTSVGIQKAVRRGHIAG